MVPVGSSWKDLRCYEGKPATKGAASTHLPVDSSIHTNGIVRANSSISYSGSGGGK